MIEFIHILFVKLINRTTGIDLSELPGGESLQSSALERMNLTIHNQDYIPVSQAEYNTIRQRFKIRSALKKTNHKPRQQFWNSWNTLR